MSDESPQAPTLTKVSVEDPHLQPYAKSPARVEAAAAALMVLGFLGFIGFGITYWISDQTQWEAATFGGGMLALGAGLIAWGKYLMAQGPFVEDRHEFHSTEEERDAMSAAIVERGGMVVQRRKVLFGLFGLGATTLGVVIMFPLIRSLGPKPGRDLFLTNWKANSQLVTSTGRAVRASDLEVGGVLTVFPMGSEGSSARPDHPHPPGRAGPG